MGCSWTYAEQIPCRESRSRIQNPLSDELLPADLAAASAAAVTTQENVLRALRARRCRLAARTSAFAAAALDRSRVGRFEGIEL
jgi:hypothetical protein